MHELIREPLFSNIEEIREIYQKYGLVSETNFLIKNQVVGIFKENEFLVGEDPYAVQCIMGKSDVAGFDIEKSNSFINLDGYTVIGLVEGDDLICIDNSTGHIYLSLIETGEGENVKIADSIETFISKINLI